MVILHLFFTRSLFSTSTSYMKCQNREKTNVSMEILDKVRKRELEPGGMVILIERMDGITLLYMLYSKVKILSQRVKRNEWLTRSVSYFTHTQPLLQELLITILVILDVFPSCNSIHWSLYSILFHTLSTLLTWIVSESHRRCIILSFLSSCETFAGLFIPLERLFSLPLQNQSFIPSLRMNYPHP